MSKYARFQYESNENETELTDELYSIDSLIDPFDISNDHFLLLATTFFDFK